MPLNPDGKGMLSPTTIFHTVISFMTNTNLQHYSGEQHFSYFSQIFFVIWNIFRLGRRSASVLWPRSSAPCASEPHMGNFFRRYVAGRRLHVLAGPRLSWACCCMQAGSAHDVRSVPRSSTLEAGAMGTTDDGAAEAAGDRARAGGRAFVPSSSWAPTAAASSAPTPRTPIENPNALTQLLSSA